MQLHNIKPTAKSKISRRVGRGGKRGTYSGRGSKGQKSRAGHRIRPGFRGDDNPIWKLFPKQRGATKKTDIKHAFFQVRYKKPAIVSLDDLNKHFSDGDKITTRVLAKKGIIKTSKQGVKVLSTGELSKKLIVSGLKLSAVAKDKIIKAGGSVE